MSDDLDDLEDALGADEDDARPGVKRLTMSEWEQVKTLWELGTTTLAELEEQFGVRADTLQKRLKAHGVVKGSKAAMAGAAIEEDAQDQAKINAKRIRETKEQHYSYAEALAKLIMQEVVSAKQQTKAFSMVDANIAALGKAAKGLSIIRKERWTLLGLDKDEGDPDDIPELIISELTEKQIIDMQAQLRGESTGFDDDLAALDIDFDDAVVEGEN